MEEVDKRASDWIGDGGPDALRFDRLGTSGLFEVGLPGAASGLDSYLAIARLDDIVARATGHPGYGMLICLRQLVARYFILGFADAQQRARWLPEIVNGTMWPAVAISEPSVGAHPKHLSTAASTSGDSYILNGRKTWITNGMQASHFLVLAITSSSEGRKHYGLFMVPSRHPGVAINPLHLAGALDPVTHAEMSLADCRVPSMDRLGGSADAYTSAAEPFRDLEDIIATVGQCGLLDWLIHRSARHLTPNEDGLLALGRAGAILSAARSAAYAGVRSLDGGIKDWRLAAGVRMTIDSTMTGLRDRLPPSANDDPALMEALRAYDLLATTARHARKVRQLRIGKDYLD
jgi:acyl-CoA dehydrogenase